jgi:sec-independent protein translocase protein TatC
MQGGKEPKAQPFSEHIRELRLRLIYTVGALFLGCGVGFSIHGPLFAIIRRPLHEQLYYTTPTGGFNAIIKVSILFGVVVTIPVLIYQLGRFLSPAFRHRIRAGRIIFSSIGLASLGLLFAYFISLPAALHFLANIDSSDLQSLITVNEYLNFVFAYVAGFALLFQIPLVMLFINRIKPQKPGGLMRIQRYVILLSFVVAAILTPTPDPVNQFIMAMPIILLYQFSIVLIWMANRRRKVVAAIEPVTIEPVPVPVADAPDGYGKAAYSGASVAPVPSSAATAPSPQTRNRPSQPRLILDIYWVPRKPAT